jgi:1-phosphatidylinositol-4-phosphate 5-kinase
MPQYVRHLTDYPDSLLVKFYGLHRVKMKSLRSKTYFVIMSSVFDTSLPIHVKYDLKGSTVGRRTEDEQCLQGAVQKDLNLQESGQHASRTYIRS